MHSFENKQTHLEAAIRSRTAYPKVVDKIQAMELVLGRLAKFRTNREFLNSF